MTQWFFVRRLIPGESQRTPLPFEVQVLDADGRATDVTAFDERAEHVGVDGIAIPEAVIMRALTYPAGFGDYVDAAGHVVDMQGNPAQSAVPSTTEERASLLVATAKRLLTMPSPYPRGARVRLELVLADYGGCSAAKQAADLLRTMSESS